MWCREGASVHQPCEVIMNVMRRPVLLLSILACLIFSSVMAQAAFSLVLTNGYGDCYRMNLLRDRENYQAYRGVCSYRGFSLSGCSTTGEVVMLRIKATPSMPEYNSIVSTSLRWGTTMYFLNDLFHPLCSWVQAGYENWFPFDMSCSVAMYIESGGFGSAGMLKRLEKEFVSAPQQEEPGLDEQRMMREILAEPPEPEAVPKAFSLVLTNGYGDCYRMNLLRDRENYQAYRGICSYRGFSLSGCSTTGEVVMLRIKATPSMPEHISLLSTSMRWGTTMYVLNDVFRPLCSWVYAGYENWYPFDMSCSVAMYIDSGGFGAAGMERAQPMAWPAAPSSRTMNSMKSEEPLRIGALVPLTGDLADLGAAYAAACAKALAEVTNTPGMPAIELLVENTDADPLVAAMKLASLYSNGVQVVIGPESSAECEALRTLVTNGVGMLMLSCGSTAVPLAIPDDSLMRLTTDDSHQARELARQIAADGITHLAVLKRSDMYGDGMNESFIQEYTNRGGTVFFDEYHPRASGFLPEVVSNLNTAVSAQLATTGADRVAVLIVAFDEGVVMLQEAAAFSPLTSVRWYGTDGMAGNTALLNSPAAREVARQTRFLCSQPAAYTNAKFAEVADWIRTQTGHSPRTLAVTSYDALGLAALALRDTGGTGTVEQVKAAIRANAATYAGATGPVFFNAADDRADGQYEFLKVTTSNTWEDAFSSLPDAPVARAASDLVVDGFAAHWAGVAGATNYLLDVATNAAFGAGDFLPDYDGAPVGSVLQYELTRLTPGMNYSYRIRAVNAAGTSPSSGAVEANLYRLDSDGDGMPDWAELVAGTEPGNSNSVFRAAGILADGQVSVQSVTGRMYQLQYTTNLLEPVWRPVPGATNIPGNNGWLVLSNAPSADIQRTYRIAVESP